MTQLTETQARDMIAVVNTRNLDKIVEQYAENATFQVPNLDKPLKGREAIRAFMKDSFVAFPDWKIETRGIAVSGNESFVVNTVHGTHDGPLVGHDGTTIPATHKKFVQEQMTHVILNEHGKVLSLRAYGNPTELYYQLGLSTASPK
ncbi:MAG: nuclear transport factor 2 family protein [Thermoplasmata archaeon]|nr:nuclear transport factor 2 family protein [Thermoplasmata archaeon]